ncbi:hypothetical protein JOF48_001504 [Arthrobacter stackebrandtii]|uniref:Uncharacterized protein n=1 Tax=Arthrobacter stackebrandtii TaxID=272161 RepID=A0ABS4YV71_9MICC|nr:hypothetical protein [Arthrobacter stackebrandtii]
MNEPWALGASYAAGKEPHILTPVYNVARI